MSAPAHVPLKIPNILLVDGDAETRLLYRTILQPFADSIDDAEDGAQALGKALCDRPSVVICETRLGRVDGVALCSLLRRDPLTKGTRSVVVTGDASPGAQQRALSAGADAVLIKPCEPDHLLATIKRVCEPRSTNRASATPRSALPSSARPNRSRTYQRQLTTTPPAPPPEAFCPTCARPLTYENSQIGGVNELFAEQWDYFSCSRCGTFRYRHRTRRLTHTSDAPPRIAVRSR